MNNFKLLAIRPLNRCHDRFLKNLTVGELYQFYNTHKFYNPDKQLVKPNQPVRFVSEKVKAPDSLFHTYSVGPKQEAKQLNINISAIAGRNGAGKSTLVELLFAAVYVYSVRNEILKPNLTSLNDVSDLRQQIRDVGASLALLASEQQDALNELKEKKGEADLEDLQALFYEYKNERYLNKRLTELEEEFDAVPRRKRQIKEIFSQLKVEVYYQCDDKYYQLIVDEELSNGKGIAINLLDHPQTENAPVQEEVDFDRHKLANYFFYTVSVNYSHYALNAEVMGDWINHLFHKNDGYTTPVVINPMRTSGNFNINREAELAKYRLLSNVLLQKYYARKKDVKVTQNQIIQKVRFTINWKKIEDQAKRVASSRGESAESYRQNTMIAGLMELVFGDKDIESSLKKEYLLKTAIINYIVRKVDRISELYPGFENGYYIIPDESMKPDNTFLRSLIDDGTHITNKLLQALYFLKVQISDPSKTEFRVSNTRDKSVFDYTLDELLDWMDVKNGAEIITKMPPSIFKIDFVLENPKAKSTSMFSHLSSGEQQLIHTIQSVIYHLNNLQSVHASKNEDRIKYRAINIVYDEIELYFHPEMQRRFIADLLAAFKRLHLDQLTNISALNILFLTHSPFILSDIPGENILLLDIDKKTWRSLPRRHRSKTFAANINDLLADNFFLKGTLMGNYAEKQIFDLIDKVNSGQRLRPADHKLLKLIGDDYLRLSIEKLEAQQR